MLLLLYEKLASVLIILSIINKFKIFAFFNSLFRKEVKNVNKPILNLYLPNFILTLLTLGSIFCKVTVIFLAFITYTKFSHCDTIYTIKQAYIYNSCFSLFPAWYRRRKRYMKFALARICDHTQDCYFCIVNPSK